MSAFRTAIDELADDLIEEIGETVAYRRGSTTLSLSAVVGASREATVDANGLMTVVRYRDFLIRRDELTLGAPAVGDRIERTVAGVVETWEVCPTSDDRGFADSDREGIKYRVHCKRVA